MPATTIFDATFGARALGLRTTALGVDVSPDITGEETRFESIDIGPGYVTTDAFEPVKATVWNVDIGSGTTDVDVYAVEGEATGQGVYIVRLDEAGDTVTITAAHATLDRIDEIYLVVEDNLYDANGRSLARLALRTGDAAASPASPGADSGWNAYELLATIDVPAAAASITACTLTDERAMSQLIVDAPSLEGFDSSYFALSSHDHDADYADLSHVNSATGHPDATASVDGFMSAADKTKLDGIEASADVNHTPSELLTEIKTVDGPGSGIDADLIDGVGSSTLQLTSHTHDGRYYTETEQNGLIAAKADLVERVYAYRSTSQAIAHATVTAISWNVETEDDWGGHAGGASTIYADGAGYYWVVCQLKFENSTAGTLRQIDLWHSGLGTLATSRIQHANGDTTLVQVNAVFKFTSGSQYVTANAYHDAGVSLNVESNDSWINVVKLY